MSWWGGGEIRPTPGVELLVRAIQGQILAPGSWPPSPGLAPWEILICRSSALTRYSPVTPKRPDATCLMAERRRSPFASGVKRSGSSPPSPVLERPPMRFMAMASVSWACDEMEPYDMAPVEKRLTMSATDSTSSIGMGPPAAGRRRMSPRSVPSFDDWSSTAAVYSLKMEYCLERVACWSLNTVRGLKRWNSPSRRHWYSPPTSSSRWARSVVRVSWADRCRVATSAASTERPTPPMRDDVPVKYSSMSGPSSPMASKTCAPVYEATVEIPIFDITLSTPLQQALM